MAFSSSPIDLDSNSSSVGESDSLLGNLVIYKYSEDTVRLALAEMRTLQAALFISLINLLFFTLVSGNCYICPKPYKPNPNPSPSTSTTPATTQSCPIDALKLGVCAKLLNGTVGAVVGTPPDDLACCSLIGGLIDLEAALCLCTAIKANILGINLNIPVSLSLLINTCGKNVPSGFQCA
ncbi:14 kDa proline-rich protein DC2.15-like [Juglans microcarpa x Juglans regia]|uniref:14 kDa proline-rich protein DC2.15-like n=1 Tax=Juglans microcarpa x Juglans regia TaxID=2249226 RepID=UPI001B7DB64E|nr:14 kDa proline-rich protein DC2.15-like [Juglans microcarpa x Juglans regia]